MRQGFKVGAVQLFTAPVVDHQAPGDGAQERPGCIQLQQFAPLQQAHEGVLGQIRGIGGIAQLAAQPGVQPAVVMAVKRVHGLSRGHEGALLKGS
ncbi:hypothetical protein D9M71_494300 [compost metagenome]